MFRKIWILFVITENLLTFYFWTNFLFFLIFAGFVLILVFFDPMESLYY